MWAGSGLETATHLTAGKHKAELSGLVFINYLLIFSWQRKCKYGTAPINTITCPYRTAMAFDNSLTNRCAMLEKQKKHAKKSQALII